MVFPSEINIKGAYLSTTFQYELLMQFDINHNKYCVTF